MTTITAFTPSASTPFQFSPTLDGNTYNAVITWNTFSQRWFINIYDLSGNLIVTLPLVGSPPNYNINLVAGYFSSLLVYRIAFGQFEVSP